MFKRMRMKQKTFCLINFLNITIALVSTESRAWAVDRYEFGNVFEFEWRLMSRANWWSVDKRRRAACNPLSALEFLLIDVAPKRSGGRYETVTHFYLWTQRAKKFTCGASRLTLIAGGKRGSVGCWTCRWTNDKLTQIRWRQWRRNINYANAVRYLRCMNCLSEMRWLWVIRHL